jgi:hypothetical protein
VAVAIRRSLSGTTSVGFYRKAVWRLRRRPGTDSFGMILFAVTQEHRPEEIIRDRTISAIDRSTVKLLAVCVSDAHGAAPRTKLGTDDAKLTRNTISLIDRDFCVFEDHAALVLEVFANDEIKIEVGHWNRLLRLHLCGD